MIRALAVILDKTWYEIYDDLYLVGREEASVSCHDDVWGLYLRMNGFEPFLLPESCPRCTTIRKFAKYYPKGKYVIGTGSHAVAVVDGDYYDSWDSGDEVPSFFWRQNNELKGGKFLWPRTITVR